MENSKTSGRLFAEQRLDFDVSIDEAILANERALHHYAAGAPFPAKPEIRRSPAIRESNIPARQFCVHRSGNIDVLYYDGTTDPVSEDEQSSHHSHPGIFDCRSCSPRAFSFDEPQQQGSVILYGGTLDTPEAAFDAGLDIPERLSDEDAKAEVLALLDGQPGPATQHSNDARTAQSHLAGQCEEQLLDSMDMDSQKVIIPETPPCTSVLPHSAQCEHGAEKPGSGGCCTAKAPPFGQVWRQHIHPGPPNA